MSSSKQPMIEVRALRKEYPVEDGPVVALDHIDLTIYQGEICCIFGPSGSGKSTLLNLLAGLEKTHTRRHPHSWYCRQQIIRIRTGGIPPAEYWVYLPVLQPAPGTECS